MTSALSKGRNSLRLLLIAEDEKDNKLYGIMLVPMIDMFDKGLQTKPTVKMPAKIAASIYKEVGQVVGFSTNALSLIGVTIVANTAVKVSIAAVAAVVLIAGVGIPVYIHNENQKAVAAMAIIQQQEEEARAASEAAEAERIAREAEAARKAAEAKAAAEKAEAERKAAEEKAEQERLAAEEAARLEAEAEAERLAAEQAEAERIQRLFVDIHLLAARFSFIQLLRFRLLN